MSPVVVRVVTTDNKRFRFACDEPDMSPQQFAQTLLREHARLFGRGGASGATGAAERPEVARLIDGHSCQIVDTSMRAVLEPSCVIGLVLQSDVDRLAAQEGVPAHELLDQLLVDRDKLCFFRHRGMLRPVPASKRPAVSPPKEPSGTGSPSAAPSMGRNEDSAGKRKKGAVDAPVADGWRRDPVPAAPGHGQPALVLDKAGSRSEPEPASAKKTRKTVSKGQDTANAATETVGTAAAAAAASAAAEAESAASQLELMATGKTLFTASPAGAGKAGGKDQGKEQTRKRRLEAVSAEGADTTAPKMDVAASSKVEASAKNAAEKEEKQRVRKEKVARDKEEKERLRKEKLEGAQRAKEEKERLSKEKAARLQTGEEEQTKAAKDGKKKQTDVDVGEKQQASAAATASTDSKRLEQARQNALKAVQRKEEELKAKELALARQKDAGEEVPQGEASAEAEAPEPMQEQSAEIGQGDAQASSGQEKGRKAAEELLVQAQRLRDEAGAAQAAAAEAEQEVDASSSSSSSEEEEDMQEAGETGSDAKDTASDDSDDAEESEVESTLSEESEDAEDAAAKLVRGLGFERSGLEVGLSLAGGGLDVDLSDEREGLDVEPVISEATTLPRSRAKPQVVEVRVVSPVESEDSADDDDEQEEEATAAVEKGGVEEQSDSEEESEEEDTLLALKKAQLTGGAGGGVGWAEPAKPSGTYRQNGKASVPPPPPQKLAPGANMARGKLGGREGGAGKQAEKTKGHQSFASKAVTKDAVAMAFAQLGEGGSETSAGSKKRKR